MQLKLKELQNVVKTTIVEENSLKNFREEICRVLGPSAVTTGSNKYIAAHVNNHIDVLERTGRSTQRESFDVRILLSVSQSQLSEVRKIAARLLPEKFIRRFLNDKSSSVRCAAADRLPYSLVKESLRAHVNDDQLRTILRKKKLSESGLPTPKEETDPFDMYGQPLGSAMKQQQGEEMSDSWYNRLAAKLTSEYGTNIEGQWEEILATRVAMSSFASSGNKIDRDKLLAAIYAFIKAREDTVLGEGSLKSVCRRLRKESFLDEAVMPIIEDDCDPIKDLVESKLSSSEYITQAERLFDVKKYAVPAGIKKHVIGEGHATETMIPVVGSLPAQLTALAENALDAYVHHWNYQQTLKGEPFKLSWSPHPMSAQKIGFSVELK